MGSACDPGHGSGEIRRRCLYPEYAGRVSYVVAVTPQGVTALDDNRDKLIENLRKIPEVNADVVERYIKAGPEMKLTGEHDKVPGDSPRIQNGIGFRLRIPYRAPKSSRLR